ncbi:class I SAM-dependent methyltransferase [Luteolibacter luteus]|uniref:Class I SAM-dependent methyltransferase n=1 Tax=Luteolibacter luteus TaxID=2728835 RepID=A0A858RQJ5_9BACT|nr:class I SAM-dependent methyltransferase [Luteolibacter luteus]QJE98901.1 class I SAM-dependent methyltransferase [Luteolibacter luteus]
MSHPVFFDKNQAASYDERSKKLAPLRDTLLQLAIAILSTLPEDARILCVGVGTGAELFVLAKRFPSWTFTALEPAGAMLDICRSKAEEEGIASRCVFHKGYLESLPTTEKFHAVTSILVSQFILGPEDRREFFAGMAERLLPGGYLVNADLSADLSTAEYGRVLEAWARIQSGAEVPPEQLERMRAAYSREVAVLPPAELGRLIGSAGFEEVTLFYQALLIHAWFARCPSETAAR